MLPGQPQRSSHPATQIRLIHLPRLSQSVRRVRSSEAEELAIHSQVVPYARQQIEKYAKLYGPPKFASVEALVNEVFRRHKIALLKAEIVNPEIAPITLTLE